MQLLECYGVGTVTMDKDVDTDEIQVNIKSLFPEADGENKISIETKSVTTQTPTGNAYSSTTLQGNTVPAKWLSVNSNRITSPDVREGSKVMVYKFKGQNTFRWTSLGMDGTLRLETIIYAFSASPNLNEDSPFSTDNYYMMLISTRDKKIQFITGQGNGEPTPYVIELDTGQGIFSLVDGENNIFAINSIEHAFSFINDEKSFINIKKKNIDIGCENQLNLTGKKQINVNADKMVVTVPDIEINGNIRQTGSNTIKGDVSVTGGFSQSGGAGNVTGGWTVDGITYLGHRHTNGNDGNPTGGVIV